MDNGPARHGDATQGKAGDMVMALAGFLSMAAAANFTSEQRAQFASAAERQARRLRGLLHGPFLLVLAREHAKQAPGMRRIFGGDSEVEVIVDRRAANAPRVAPQVERRREATEQRVAGDLRRIGAALVKPEAPAAARPPAPAADASNPSRCRVLLIDDDAAVVQMLTSYFADGKAGYVVEAALTGEKGLAKLQACRPSVVLLDISMPGMNGLEVLARIRTIDPSIPVIMITGANYQETSQALKDGAFAYLPKPFDFRYVDHLVTLATGHKPQLT